MKKALTILSFLLLGSLSLAQWTLQTSPTTETLRFIMAVDDNVVWACGYAGVVTRTTDGGTTWTLTTPPDAGYDNYTMYAISANVAWVLATEASTSVGVKIFKTTDGGVTWTQQWQDATTFGNGIVFFDANNGVAFCDPIPVTEWIIVTTSDGGTTWNKVPQTNIPPADGTNGEFGLATSMVNVGNEVWFSSYTNIDSRVYHSADKGLTWTKTETLLPGASSGSIYMAFKNNKFAVTSGGDQYTGITTDGGTTWTYGTTKHGVVVRGITYVPNTSSLLAVGSSGKSVMSNDDGATWTAVATTAEAKHLRHVTATANYAWCSGEGGNIYKWSGQNLPVELTSFSAQMNNGKVNLKWTTATEMNNAGFEIERKADNGDWRLIAYKQGKGTTSEQNSYNYSDDVSKLNAKEITYRLKQIDFGGAYTYSTEVKVNNLVPEKFEMSQNYPNPFNPTTMIKYGLPVESNVSITVYNTIGQLVEELVSSVQQAGYYEVPFNATNLTTGTYFYSIKAQPVDGEEGFNTVKKMLLVK